tara:strand:- start:321 stop:611 length:291 start_codon:yes stop_codon:yes gene_type:complete
MSYKQNADRQHQQQNKKEIDLVYSDVEKQVKVKGIVTASILMSRQSDLYNPERTSNNDYCKFKRGLQYRDVVLCDGTIINIPVPVTSGSGSRGSKF